DPHAAFRAISKDEVLVAITYTRSSDKPNGSGSHMQGGVVLARITPKGVEMGTPKTLPMLNGNRAFMRPLVAISDNSDQVLVTAAAEDNGVNNNPQPVAYVLRRTGLDLAVAQIPNSTRGATAEKPTNLIRMATNRGISVPDAAGQRGMHS